MHRKAYLLLLATALFWGGNAIAGKLAVGHVSPMLLTMLRWALAFAVLLVIGWHRFGADWPVVRARLPFLGVMGFLGFSAFNLALYTALLYTTAINVSIEQAGMPALIFAANFLIFRMGVGLGQVAGFLLSLAGVLLTASHGEFARLSQLDLNFGDALMLIAIILYAVYTVALRLKPDIHWTSFMIVLTGAAAITSVPFAAWEWAAGAMIWPDSQGWAVVLYTVFFPSLLSQVFYVRGVELIGPNRAGLFINLVPIFGTLLSVLLLGERFFAYHAVALVMVLGGIWLAERSGRKRAGS